MKAVIYHAKAKIAENFPPLTYEKLIHGLRKNLNQFDIPLIHLSVYGQMGMGDENHYFDGDPADIIWNREKFFIEFLKEAPDDVYWFTEPDSRIAQMFPPLAGDLALLRRNDSVAITPAWRLAKKSALPFFEEAFTYYVDEADRRQWHGDSVAYIKMWEQMGKPNVGQVKYNGMDIDLRDYDSYCRPNAQYTEQWKANNKIDLLRKEYV
jgi:hypothetical protein